MLSSAMAREVELLNAVKAGDLQGVTRLLAKTKPVKSKLLYSNKRTNVNAQDQDGMSSLHQAALMCHVPIMQLLLDSGALVDTKDHKCMRPLHYAAWQGRSEPVSLLLQYNSSVNDASSAGETPLHLSCQHGHLGVTKELLRCHANPSIRNNDHKAALDLACEFGRIKVVELLLMTNRCRQLLECSAQDVLDNERTTCLHLAARNGHVELLRLLLAAGVDINRSTLRGTALHEAALHGKLEAVKLLIESGIDVSRTNSYDQTALDIVKSFTTCRAAKEMKQLLKEVINAVQARAIRNHFDPADPDCLPLKEGELLTVLEQRSDGRWKGILFREDRTSLTGFFPATAVQLLLHRPATNVGAMPHRNSTLKSSIKKVSPPVVPPEHLLLQQQHRHSGGSYTSSGYGSQPSSCTDRSSCSSFGLEEAPLTPAPHSPASHGLPRGGGASCDGDYFRHGGVLPSPTRPSCNVFAFPEQTHHIHRTQVVVHARPSGGSGPSTPVKDSPNGFLGTPASLEDQGIDVSPGRESPGGSSSSRGSGSSSGNEPCCPSSRHSTSSLDSGRASAAGSEAKAPPHRLSVPGFDTVLRHSYHSSSTSSLSSLERLQEEGSHHVIGCNVAEMILHAVPDGEILRAWLSSLHFEEYTGLFVQAGYDMPTISRMTPEDLTAIGVTKPAHRRKLKAEIAKLNISDGIPDHKPNSLLEWLQLLRLEDYYHGLCHQGYDTVDRVTELQWEDLEEIGIKKLGHQKKVMLAIKRVKSINNSSNQGPSSTCSSWTPRVPDHLPLPQRPPTNHVSTLPRPTSLGNGGVNSYQRYLSQEVAITTSRGKAASPTTDVMSAAQEFKTFQQSPPKEGYLRLSNGDLRSPVSLQAQHLLCQADLVAVQVRSPNRGRSLESLDMDDSISMVSHQVFHSGPDSWYDTVSAYRQHGYDTDSELSHSSGDSYLQMYEPDCTATLHRPKGMVKPRPVAKIIAKTRWSEPDVTLVGENELDPKLLLKGAPDYVVDGWASLESSPRHFPSRNNGTTINNNSDIYGTLKGKRTPPPPPKRTNSMRSERNATTESVLSEDSSYQAMKDKAFATCVKGLASRFNMDTELGTAPEDCRIPSPAPSEDFPPPPSPLPSAVEDFKDVNGIQLPKDLLGELQGGQLLLRQRRKDSADSSVSTSSSESNSLPFANENVSTIVKQKVVTKPPLPSPTEQRSRVSPVATLRKAGPSINHQVGPKALPARPSANPMAAATALPNADDISNSTGMSSGDVIDDIEHMLANLSNQLDAMLESEMNN